MFQIQNSTHVYRQRFMRNRSMKKNSKYNILCCRQSLKFLLIWNKQRIRAVVTFQICSSLNLHLPTAIQWQCFFFPSAKFAWSPCCIHLSNWIKYGFRNSLVGTWRADTCIRSYWTHKTRRICCEFVTTDLEVDPRKVTGNMSIIHGLHETSSHVTKVTTSSYLRING